MESDKINAILFKGKISISAIERMKEYGLLPKVFEPSTMEPLSSLISEWKKTFVGRFVMKYPRYYGLIMKISECLGKVPEWTDFTRENIDSITDLFSSCAQSSARTYLAMLKAVLNDAKDEINLPYIRFSERMSVKPVPSVHIHLTLKDLKKLECYRPDNDKESVVLAQFLIGCYTGARHSDVMEMEMDNMRDGYITYVSKKTKMATTVEAKPILNTLLPVASKRRYSDSVFNDTIREICRKVGMTERVKLFRRGKDEAGMKYEFVASHTARRSFATNLAELNVPLLQIARRMGHTDIKMTMRYICCGIGRLDSRADMFFK